MLALLSSQFRNGKASGHGRAVVRKNSKFAQEWLSSPDIRCLSPISSWMTGALAAFARAIGVVVVLTRSLPKNGGMAEDQEAGQLPSAWTRDRRETESRQRASSAKSP